MLAGLAYALCASLTLINAAGPLPIRRNTALVGGSNEATRLEYRTGHFARDRDAMFVPDFVKREMNGLLLKYEQAAALLGNVTGMSAPDIDGDQNGIKQQLPLYSPASTVVGDQSIRLNDYGHDVLYYGPLSVGNPPQALDLIPDTGSADLWFLTGCKSCKSKQFLPSTSITYGRTTTDFYVSYGNGYARGTLAEDTVSLATLVVEHQYFGAVDEIASSFANYPNSGVLGLGFGAISQTKTNTFFENLIRGSKISSQLFSIALAPSTGASELCLGCINQDKYSGDIAWLPVQSRTYWTLGMTGLSVNSASIVAVGLVAAIDSGTSQIYVPMQVATALYASIPGSSPAPQYGSGFWTFPCNSPLNVTLSFDGVPFSISPDDFNLGKTASNSTDCVGGVLGFGDDLPSYFAVVGAGFLKSWYAIFDYSQGGRVGFARSTSRQQTVVPRPAGHF